MHPEKQLKSTPPAAAPGGTGRAGTAFLSAAACFAGVLFRLSRERSGERLLQSRTSTLLAGQGLSAFAVYPNQELGGGATLTAPILVNGHFLPSFYAVQPAIFSP